MVSSDVPPPMRPAALIDSLLKRVHRKCYIVFKDERGVVYCERANSHLITLAKVEIYSGGRHSDLLRTIVPYHSGEQEKFIQQVRNCYEMGYTLEQDRYYAEPNRWGPVKALKVITDLRAGAALKAVLDKGTPEAMNGKDRDFNPKPVEPFTSHVLRTIMGEDRESMRDMARKYNGPRLKEAELLWLQAHGADLDGFELMALKNPRFG